MLPETSYVVNIDDNGKLTTITIKGEDVDDWVEAVAIRKYYAREDALVYYKSSTNSNPLYVIGYVEDKQCRCIKNLGGTLILSIKEINE